MLEQKKQNKTQVLNVPILEDILERQSTLLRLT